MPGVGYAYHPDVDPTDENEEIHLWKSISKDESQTYCEEHTVDKRLSKTGMTQVTKSSLDNWDDQDSVCDACVEAAKEQYY